MKMPLLPCTGKFIAVATTLLVLSIQPAWASLQCTGKVTQVRTDGKALYGTFSFNSNELTLCHYSFSNQDYSLANSGAPSGDTCNVWLAQLMAAKAANENVIVAIEGNGSDDCKRLYMGNQFWVGSIAWTNQR